MRLIAVLTVLGEASFLPLLVARWRDRRLIGATAVGFHLLTRRYLGISFWHLWWLYPALFVVPLPGDDRSDSTAHRLGVALLKGVADQLGVLPSQPNGV